MSADARDPSIPKSFETLGEHYRLVEKLGEGAFGVVYRAHHDLLDQDFAVKILKPELCEDPDVRDRFLDEARALIRFSHGNVVQLRHVGEHLGRLYLVMDLVRGHGLQELLRRDGALKEARAVSLMGQVLAGLDAAHAAGIVHRDLKPGNLMVDKDPSGNERIRILDFGLSKLSVVDGVKGAHRSVTGAIIGTLAYMSPEQLSGEADVDQRSDIFAAGLILHEMLDGHHPYPEDSGIVVAAKLLREPVPDLDPKRSNKLAPSTRSALRQSLERDRDARFTTAFAFQQALEGMGPPSDTSRVTTIEEARRELARAEARQRVAATEKDNKRRNLVLAGLAVVVLGAGALFFTLKNGDDGPGGGEQVARQPDPEPPPTPPVDPRPEQPPEPVDPAPARPPEPVEPPPEDPPPPVDPARTPVAPPPVTPLPPERVPPEPVTPPVEPATPEPAVPEPVTPEPVTPAIPVPEVPPNRVPQPPVQPEATHARAEAHLTAGEWRSASEVWKELAAADPKDVKALRGASMTGLRHADSLARRGHLDEALAALDGLVAWLDTMYAETYEPLGRTQRQAMMHPMGFTKTHLGEAHTQRARWLRVKGDRARETAALKSAEEDLKLAWQFLDRDGERYWDFLLRRADFHLLSDNRKAYVQDLAATTKVASDLVPPRMWVAHFVGLRRMAESALTPRGGPGGRPVPERVRPGAGGGARRELAARIAEEALQVAKQGRSWTHRRGQVFTRAQWLEAGRVIVVRALAMEPLEDATALHGLLGWYLEEAAKQPPLRWEDEQGATARLRPLQAGLELMSSRMSARKGDTTGAQRKQEKARSLVQEGVALREQVAAAGGELPSAWPYLLLAQVLRESGDTAGAQQALEKARAAAARNPESGPIPTVVPDAGPR